MDCTTKKTLTPIEQAIEAHRAAREKEANAAIMKMARDADERWAAKEALRSKMEALLCAIFGRDDIYIVNPSFTLHELDIDGDLTGYDGTFPIHWAIYFRWGGMDFHSEGLFYALEVKDGSGEWRPASTLEAIGAALAEQHGVALDLAA